MSRSKDKGTKGENEIVELFHAYGMLDAHRTENAKASHDIHLPPITVEVKWSKSWTPMKWIRKIRSVAPDGQWAIYTIHGDRRTIQGAAVGRVAILDADFATELIAHWRTNK